MGILIKTSEDQSFWIDVDGSKFLVCPITSTEDARIAKKYTKFKNGFPNSDQAKIRTEKFKKTVKDWKGVEDVNGKQVPYSDDMRDNFAKYNPDYAWQILRRAEQHEVDEKEVEDDNLGE